MRSAFCDITATISSRELGVWVCVCARARVRVHGMADGIRN
jgi:hypothetical protein